MLIDDLAQHIHNQGVASLGTNLFKGHLPPSPNTAVSVIETGGVEPNPDIPLESPTFQIFIRSDDYSTGRNLLASARSLFHQKKNTQLVPSGKYLYYILAISEGGHLGRDENGNDLFSINFRCLLRDAS